MPDFDYGDYVDKPEGDGLAELRRLADELEQAQERVAEAEAALKAAQQTAKHLAEEVLPGKMAEVGLEMFKTPSGFTLEIKEQVFAHIAKARAAAAYRWLEENGHGGMIKRHVLVAFNKDQEEAASKLHANLQLEFSGVTQKLQVNAGTLKAWAKRMLEAGEEVPLDLFGIHTKTVAKPKK